MSGIDKISELLARRAGLDVDALGRGAVEATLRDRQRSSGGDVEAYLRKVAGDDAEAAALIEDVLVPETWFFRDGAPFDHLAQLARERPHNRRMTVLSLPSSTGEEAYSIAMTLLDLGMAPELISIDAIDLSPKLIARGRRGIYERGSFRGADLSYRSRHFTPVGSGWQISERVRGCVTFSQGNCLDPGLLVGRGPYDAVFFRNLLIYLTPPARIAALHTVVQRLSDDGVIYAGHAEALDRIDPQLRGLPHSGAFAFRRAPPEPSIPTPVPAPPRRPTGQIPAQRAPEPTPAVKQTGSMPTLRAATPPPVATTPTLASIRALADRGRLADAAAACTQFQRENPLSGDGFFLRGLIHGAAGEDDLARVAFEKAIYLAPDHYEALSHLAIVAERRGDHAAAERLRRRAERVAKK